jgi:DNA-directed RNA polymerase specialized sigma24 family protein
MNELQRDSIDRLFEVKTRGYTEERFSRLIGNSGNEYRQAWKELREFAMRKASRYFHDRVSQEDAVDKAMSGIDKDKPENKDMSVVTWLIKIHHEPELLKGIDNPWGYAKTIIDNRLKKLSREREYESFALKELRDGEWEDTGFQIEQPVDKTKPLKVRIDRITNKKHKEIVEMRLKGMTHKQISEKVGLERSSITKILQLYF